MFYDKYIIKCRCKDNCNKTLEFNVTNKKGRVIGVSISINYDIFPLEKNDAILLRKMADMLDSIEDSV